MEDKGKMDEIIEQMKLMNERMYNIENLLEASVYHQRRIDFTSEYVARQQGYMGFINEDIAVAPKPPSRLFGNHFIKIYDDRLYEKRKLERDGKGQGDIDWVNRKHWGRIDTNTRVDDIHDYREDNGRAQYLLLLTEDDANKKDFVWLSGDIKLYEEIERRPFKEGEKELWQKSWRTRCDWSEDKHTYLTNLTEVELIHRVPVLTETSDLGGAVRRAKAEAEETKHLKNGEKFEFTPEQSHEIVNNTPEGQRLSQEKNMRLGRGSWSYAS